MSQSTVRRCTDDGGDEPRISSRNLLFISVVANIGSLLFGYETGAAAWVIYTINKDASDDDSSANYYNVVTNSSLLTGLIASFAALGAVISYPFLLVYGNSLSKKDEMLISGLLFFLGSVLQDISDITSWDNATGVILLMVGRFIYGGGIASCLHSVPQYISELTPTHVRGQYGSSIELMVMIGMLLGFTIGYIYETVSTGGWSVTFRIAAFLSLLMGLLALQLPHNPIWLIHYGFKDSEVLEALRFVYPDADLAQVRTLRLVSAEEDETAARLVAEQDERQAVLRGEFSTGRATVCCQSTGSWSVDLGLYDLLTPQLRLVAVDQLLFRCLLVKIILNVLKIWTGQTIILYYSSEIFATFSPTYFQEWVFAYISVRILVVIIMLLIGEYEGRRFFMLWSVAFMALGLFVAFIGLTFGDIQFLGLVGIFTAGIGFEFGFGCIAYFLLNEVVPFSIRSAANAVANFALFVCYFAVTFLFPFMLSGMGLNYVLLLFAGVNVVAIYTLYFYLPETKGVDIEVAYKLVGERFDSAPTLCCVNASVTSSSSNNRARNSCGSRVSFSGGRLDSHNNTGIAQDDDLHSNQPSSADENMPLL